MKSGFIDVQLLHGEGNDTPYGELAIKGTSYFIAEPDEYYRVKVSVDKELMAGSGYLGKFYLVSLKIDGRNVGYSRVIGNSIHFWVIFDGILKNASQRYPFKFAATVLAAEDEAAGVRSASSDAGMMEITMHEAGEPYPSDSFKVAKFEMPEAMSIDKNKKFWLQSSATTVIGDKAREVVWGTMKYPKLRATPDFTLTIPYHTLGVLRVLELQANAEVVGDGVGSVAVEQVNNINVVDSSGSSSLKNKSKKKRKLE